VSVRGQIACRIRLRAIRHVAVRPVFHPGTPFQSETPGDIVGISARVFHREPRGFGLKPASAAAPP